MEMVETVGCWGRGWGMEIELSPKKKSTGRPQPTHGQRPRDMSGFGPSPQNQTPGRRLAEAQQNNFVRLSSFGLPTGGVTAPQRRCDVGVMLFNTHPNTFPPLCLDSITFLSLRFCGVRRKEMHMKQTTHRPFLRPSTPPSTKPLMRNGR